MIDTDALHTLREILNVSELESDVLEILGDHHYMYSKIAWEIDEEYFKEYFEVPEGITCWDYIENRNNNSMEQLTDLGFTWNQSSAALDFVQ